MGAAIGPILNHASTHHARGERRSMPVEIEEMPPQEAHALLARVGYGHLGCARDNRPYVIPIHYAYD